MFFTQELTKRGYQISKNTVYPNTSSAGGEHRKVKAFISSLPLNLVLRAEELREYGPPKFDYKKHYQKCAEKSNKRIEALKEKILEEEKNYNLYIEKSKIDKEDDYSWIYDVKISRYEE